MDRPYQINDFVSFNEPKPGTFKISCSVSQEACIYRWLAAQGFGLTSVGGKTIMFRKIGEQVRPTKIWQMKDAFRDFIEAAPYDQLPEGLTTNDLMEWYYRTLPIKRNHLYRRYLKSTLTEAEIHTYRMNAHSIYCQRYRVGQVLEMLANSGFKQTYDQAGTVGKGQTLYYRLLAGHRFLIFSHHNAGNKASVDGFDCWLASFRNESQIGRIKTESLKDIRLSFQMDRDYPLIAAYLEN